MPLRQATIWKVVVGTIQLGSSQFCTSFLFPMDVCSRGVPVCIDFFFCQMADENVMSPSENYKTNEKKKEDSIGLGVYSLRVCGFDAGTSLWDNCNADWPG